MTRLARLVAIPALVLGLAVPSSAQDDKKTPNPNDAGFAQQEIPMEEDKGDPLYGYVACAFLCAFCIFAVCKSSRR